jgi:HdeA/HdeB family
MISSKSLRAALVAAATLVAAASASQAQTPLTAYEDAKGYLNVRALTCSQLTGTTQDDANFLGAWYSGWWNGHVKRHAINIDRAKKGLHEVLVYCQANPNTKVVDAVDAYVKKMQQGQ